MKTKIKFIILALIIPGLNFSCFYPHANLTKIKSTNGENILQIKYDSPKIFSYEIARRENKWAILFEINDSKSISFPPPGAEIDNRWFYYLGIVDEELNPIWKKPILIEEHKNTNETYTGQTSALFPQDNGYLIIFFNQNNFYFMEFDLNGKKLTGKKIFYTGKKNNLEKNRILSISFHQDIIYLFLLNGKENIYIEQSNINLVKYEMKTEKVTNYPNFISNPKDWYYLKQMSVNFTGNSMEILWIDGEKQNLREGLFTLLGSVYFSKCGLDKLVCNNSRIIFKSNEYDKLDALFNPKDNNGSLLISENENLWIQRISEEEFSNEKPKQINRSANLKYFQNKKNFPFKVTIGSGY